MPFLLNTAMWLCSTKTVPQDVTWNLINFFQVYHATILPLCEKCQHKADENCEHKEVNQERMLLTRNVPRSECFVSKLKFKQTNPTWQSLQPLSKQQIWHPVCDMCDCHCFCSRSHSCDHQGSRDCDYKPSTCSHRHQNCHANDCHHDHYCLSCLIFTKTHRAGNTNIILNLLHPPQTKIFYIMLSMLEIWVDMPKERTILLEVRVKSHNQNFHN